MKTIRQTIARASRLLRIAGGEGQRSVPAVLAADGLEAAIGMYQSFIGNGLFGPTEEVLSAVSCTAKENQRIINTSGGSITITLPTTITDCGVTRAPEDRSFVIEAGSTPKTYVYDADQAAWVRLETLTLDSNAPFSSRFEAGLAALLAAYISAEYGVTMSPVATSMATTAHAAMRIKRPIVQSVDRALLRGLANHRFGVGSVL